MRETYWKWHLYLFMKAADADQAMVAEFARIYVENGSGELLENEKKFIDCIKKYSLSGETPVQVYGVGLPVMISMREEFLAWIHSHPEAYYVVTSNTDLNGYKDNELVLTNFEIVPNGQIVDWTMIDEYLLHEFGLREIKIEE
jgi:hypothetical protein